MRRKAEIREQLALLVEDTEVEEEDMKRHHNLTELPTEDTVVENETLEEKRPRQDARSTGSPLIEPVTHFNETEAVTELHYDDNSRVSHFSETIAPTVSSPTPVNPNMTDGWEMVDSEGAGVSEGDNDSAEGSAPSSREPNPLPGQTVSSEPPTGSLSSEHSKPLKPTSSNQKSKSHHREGQGTSLLDKMKRSRWKSTELKGHEDLVMDCDLDVQLGLGVTCSRDTTVKVKFA